MSEVKYYPLDVTSLQKGQVLDIPQLEKIMNVERHDLRWPLKLLNLRAQIERLRAKMGLPVVTMRIRGGCLVVCDDTDASQYNRSMGKRGIRRFVRASVRNVAVDTSKLDDEQKQAHGRTLMRNAMMLAAIRSAQHRGVPSLEPPKRVTPKMVTGPDAKETVVQSQ